MTATQLDTPLTDDELTALALAADPDAPIAADAVSTWDVLHPDATHRLPDWYMPTPIGGGRRLRGWPRRLAFLVVLAFLAVDAVGLCSTYGII